MNPIKGIESVLKAFSDSNVDTLNPIKGIESRRPPAAGGRRENPIKGIESQLLLPSVVYFLRNPIKGIESYVLLP